MKIMQTTSMSTEETLFRFTVSWHPSTKKTGGSNYTIERLKRNVSNLPANTAMITAPSKSGE
jgi:hypothetical protein